MAEHLEACLPPIPGRAGCDAVRELYGACPDHDALCVAGCPVTGGGDAIETP